MKKISSFIFTFLMLPTLLLSQDIPRKILKNINAVDYKYNGPNSDGVFKAKHKKTGKWGMFQLDPDQKSSNELIPMAYDSINAFHFNGNVTGVWNDGKVGLYSSYFSYGEDARQTVECLYDDFRRITVWRDRQKSEYTAVKKDSLWAWIDWKTGELQTKFLYKTTEELPYPRFLQYE